MTTEYPTKQLTAEAFRDSYPDDGGTRFGPRANYLTDLARRCAPWQAKATLVFVERRLYRTYGHSFFRHYFPGEGVVLGFPMREPNSDGNFLVRADEHLTFYKARRCPANHRFLDRVGYRYRRGNHRGPGHFELYRLPAVAELWSTIQRDDIGSYQLPFTAWRVTAEQAQALADLCERREFLFNERAEPSRKKAGEICSPSPSAV